MTTASHGGLALSGPAVGAVPHEVAACLINGPGWAEEDIELAIVMAVLDNAERIDRSAVAFDMSEMHKAALYGATHYGRYEPAIALLQKPAAARSRPERDKRQEHGASRTEAAAQ